jgi:hypothetical protein
MFNWFIPFIAPYNTQYVYHIFNFIYYLTYKYECILCHDSLLQVIAFILT